VISYHSEYFNDILFYFNGIIFYFNGIVFSGFISLGVELSAAFASLQQ